MSSLHDPGLPGADDTPIGTIRPLPAGEPRPDRPTRFDRIHRGGRRRRRVRRAVRALLLLLTAVLVYYLISLFQVWSTGRNQDAGPADAIVVMGAAQYDGTPSPQLAARLDHVVDIWPANVAPLIIVTGGNQPGDRFTESAASAAYLIARGIPASAIVEESTGATTYESLEGVAAIMRERGLDSVVIVTDPYHALRCRLIAQSFGLDATVSTTRTSVVTGGTSVLRHLQEAAGVAIGRLIGFDRL